MNVFKATLHKKMKFFIKNFFIMRIWSRLLKKPFIENIIFCAVRVTLKHQINVSTKCVWNWQ